MKEVILCPECLFLENHIKDEENVVTENHDGICDKCNKVFIAEVKK